MKRLIFMTIATVFISGCNNMPPQLKNVAHSEISKVVITDMDERQCYEILDTEKIESLFTDYLYRSRKTPVKFRPYYKITFSSPNEDYEIYVSGRVIRLNGVSYKCRRNLAKFIKMELIDE